MDRIFMDFGLEKRSAGTSVWLDEKRIEPGFRWFARPLYRCCFQLFVSIIAHNLDSEICLVESVDPISVRFSSKCELVIPITPLVYAFRSPRDDI